MKVPRKEVNGVSLVHVYFTHGNMIMNGNRTSDLSPGRARIRRFLVPSLVIAALAFPFLCSSRGSDNTISAQTEGAPQPIYSDNPTDSWNRIFHCMFSRRFKVRFSSEFPEAAPFAPLRKGSDIQVSTRAFDRIEVGDRPVDPLYHPNPDSPEGSRQVLTEPMYSQFASALRDALAETTPRSPVARAWMQADLWAAYDILVVHLFPEDRNTDLDRHRHNLLDLLAQLIRKISLTLDEIKNLPDNYRLAMSGDSLPDLFNKNGDWIELEWFARRVHSEQADFRRVTRVFVKPAQPVQDKQKFVNALRDSDPDSPTLLDGVALVMQPLLIDSRGSLTPTRLTAEVQLRLFKKTNISFQPSEIRVAELSRRLTLTKPESGSLATEAANSQAYLSAGGEYGFASSQFETDGPTNPVVVKLHTRCALCHGPNLTVLMTFAIVRVPGPVRPVRVLNPESHEAAQYDIAQKAKQPSWRALHAYFNSNN